MTQFLTFVFVLGLSILIVATVGWGAGPAFFSSNGSEDAAGLRASMQRME